MGASPAQADRNLLTAFVLATLLPLGCAGTDDSRATPQTPTGVQNCGTVTLRGTNPPTDSAALQAEQCFAAAYGSCQPATLTVENRGVDITSTTTFTIQAGAACGITATTDTALVPGNHVTSSFACGRLTSKDGGLLFVACGTIGDIFVPPPTP